MSEVSESVRSGSIHRIPAIDGLRALAVLTVIGFHCYVAMIPLGVLPGAVVQHALFTFMTSAVDLFFVISGFVITSVLDATRSADRSIATFYKRRAMRIIPLYYGFLLVTMPLLSHLPASIAGPPGGRMWQWLFMTNIKTGLFGWASVAELYRPFWTIAIEEQFYIVWPWVVLLLSRKRVVQVCGGLIAMSVIARLVVALAGHFEVGIYLSPMRLDGLAAGSAIALLQRIKPKFVKLAGDRAFTWFPPLLVLNWAISLLLFAGNQAFAFAYMAVACPLVFSLSYAALVSRFSTRSEESKHHWLASSPLMAIARYSYGMYAVHTLLLSLLIVWAVRRGMSVSHHALLYWMSCFAAVGGVSFLVGMTTWKLYEAPILRRAPRYTRS